MLISVPGLGTALSLIHILSSSPIPTCSSFLAPMAEERLPNTDLITLTRSAGPPHVPEYLSLRCATCILTSEHLPALSLPCATHVFIPLISDANNPSDTAVLDRQQRRHILADQIRLGPAATGDLTLLLNAIQLTSKFIATNVRKARLINLYVSP
jgi:hypothetical protein